MINYKYSCLNPACQHKDFQIIKKPESKENETEFCLTCGEPLKLLGYIPHGGIGKFAAMTPTQRQEVLRKRSSEHFKTSGIEERKIAMNQAFDREAKEMFTR